MPPTASECLILSALASLNAALTQTSLSPSLHPPSSYSSLSSTSTSSSSLPSAAAAAAAANQPLSSPSEAKPSTAQPNATRAPGTGETPRLARLRRRRNRLVAMLMFELTAVATGNMPEFAAYDVGTPWDFVPASTGPGNNGAGDNGGQFGGAAAADSGTGTESDAWGTGPGLAIHSELGGSGMLWYLKQREAGDEEDEEAENTASGEGGRGDVGGEGGGGARQMVVVSHPREVRRLVAVFEAGWKSVLRELDLNVLAQRGDEDDRRLAPFLWTEEVIRAEERTKRTLKKMQRIGRRIEKKVEMDRKRVLGVRGRKWEAI